MLCSLGCHHLAPGGTLGIFGWGCAAGTLEPLAYTSVEPIYGSYLPPPPPSSPRPLAMPITKTEIIYVKDND